MKAILKMTPKKHLLDVTEVFTSSMNAKKTNYLINELTKAIAGRYDVLRRDLYSWLGTLHYHQRGRYIKEIAGKLETDNRWLYSNSRLNKLWILYDIALIIINQFTNFYHVYEFFNKKNL